MKLFKQAVLGLAFIAASAAASAGTSFNITGGSFTVGSGYGTNNGQLDVLFQTTMTPQSFTLNNPGDTHTFSFGKVTLRESCINTGNSIADFLLGCAGGGSEIDNLGVTANLQFADPLAGTVQNVAVVGVLAGPVNPVFGINFTDLWIDFAPVLVNFGTEGKFLVDFEDMAFDMQEFQTSAATITLKKNDVPEPATLALLGVGMLGMGGLRRRKAA